MGRGKDRFEQLLELLPGGWEEKAGELKAFQRARGIKTPKELLKIILLYLTKGKSFRGTSAIMRLSGEAEISDVAILKRIRNSAAWLQWLCGNIYRRVNAYGVSHLLFVALLSKPTPQIAFRFNSPGDGLFPLSTPNKAALTACLPFNSDKPNFLYPFSSGKTENLTKPIHRVLAVILINKAICHVAIVMQYQNFCIPGAAMKLAHVACRRY
jgi:hypothetical protein